MSYALVFAGNATVQGFRFLHFFQIVYLPFILVCSGIKQRNDATAPPLCLAVTSRQFGAVDKVGKNEITQKKD
jgi:hypothetical protein